MAHRLTTRPTALIAVGVPAAVGLVAFVVLERERLSDVVPRTRTGWLRVGPLVLGLALLLLVVLPRLIRRAPLRRAIAAVVLGATAWFTVAPVFFDKRVDEQLLGATAVASPSTAPPVNTAAADGPSPAAGQTDPMRGPIRLSTGPLEGRGGHSASGAASVYRLADGSAF